ncbi:hypothetical protein [Oceanobacillus neutriphilus]|uniref:DUF5668 domain-containing protein n=1 Tax=Oceanobacillus neutriphilus TaxID=531815 RepID=A0ABQ2NSY8_9BACI|nr:hypothetical protein [Oceanobacillus neutriphilus]GGP09108.1 hypothetical protein GCM10011346_11840 [Oceanobacillus neutriphilus]
MKKIQGGKIVNKKSLQIVGFLMTFLLIVELFGVNDEYHFHSLPWAVILPIGIIGIAISIFSNFVTEKKPEK